MLLVSDFTNQDEQYNNRNIATKPKTSEYLEDLYN